MTLLKQSMYTAKATIDLWNKWNISSIQVLFGVGLKNRIHFEVEKNGRPLNDVVSLLRESVDFNHNH